MPRPPSAPPLPSCSGRPCPPVGGPSGTLLPDSLKEDCWYNGPWPSESCSDEAHSVVLPPPPLNQASLDDSSRSFPSPPKPSDAIFWEGHSNASTSSSLMGNYSPRSPPNAEWAKPFWEEHWRDDRWFLNSVTKDGLLPHSYHLTCLKLIRPLLPAELDGTCWLWLNKRSLFLMWGVCFHQSTLWWTYLTELVDLLSFENTWAVWLQCIYAHTYTHWDRSVRRNLWPAAPHNEPHRALKGLFSPYSVVKLYMLDFVKHSLHWHFTFNCKV